MTTASTLKHITAASIATLAIATSHAQWQGIAASNAALMPDSTRS